MGARESKSESNDLTPQLAACTTLKFKLEEKIANLQKELEKTQSRSREQLGQELKELNHKRCLLHFAEAEFLWLQCKQEILKRESSDEYVNLDKEGLKDSISKVDNIYGKLKEELEKGADPCSILSKQRASIKQANDSLDVTLAAVCPSIFGVKIVDD